VLKFKYQPLKLNKMINENVIFKHLDSAFELMSIKHKTHKTRVGKAIKWFNENSIDKSSKTIANSKVIVNKCPSICVEHNFRGAPDFECYFIFMPYNSNDNCGSGCGVNHKIEF
jgi:hypothetical protein